MDSLKIYKVLPMLEDYENNVVDWIEDLSNLMRVCNIKDPERIFTWASEAVDSNTKAVLRRLINKRTGVYPSLKEIQKAVEEHLGITEGDKLTYLQGLKIKENETIKTFNDRYRRLYHDLSRDYQKIVSVKTYRNAIKSRNFAYSQVFMSKCDSLNEAYEIAETAEEAEKEWNKPDNNNINKEYQIRTTNNKRNIRNLSMLTQNTSFPRRNRNPTFNYFNADPRNNYQRNNNMINNNWNTNNNEYSFNNSNNFNLYNPNRATLNNSYGNYHTNGNINNFNNSSNRRNNNFNYINNGTNNYNAGVPQNNYNNIQGYNNYHDQNNQIKNPYIKNRKEQFINNSDIQNRIQQGLDLNSPNYTLYCHRCYQEGHKSNKCPYTFKQLAEMEEKGLLNNNHLN